MTRIAVWGYPGSGKTTFALKLSHQLGHKLIHTDKLSKDYECESFSHFKKAALAQIDSEKWILDGNLGELRLAVLNRADLVLILNLSILVGVWRIIARTVTRQTRFRLTQGYTKADGLDQTMNITEVFLEIYQLIKIMINFKLNFFTKLKLMSVKSLKQQKRGKLVIFTRQIQIDEFIKEIN